MRHKCDFCSDPHVKWTYPAASFDVEALAGWAPTHSEGNWAACDACHELIERNDHRALAMRSAKGHPDVRSGQVPIRLVLEHVKRYHEEFFEHRSGPARPLEEGEAFMIPEGYSADQLQDPAIMEAILRRAHTAPPSEAPMWEGARTFYQSAQNLLAHAPPPFKVEKTPIEQLAERAYPPMLTAHPIIIEAEQMNALDDADWSFEEAAQYALMAHLPFEPVYLDFGGRPHGEHVEVPIFEPGDEDADMHLWLHGALFFRAPEGQLCVAPFLSMPRFYAKWEKQWVYGNPQFKGFVVFEDGKDPSILFDPTKDGEDGDERSILRIPLRNGAERALLGLYFLENAPTQIEAVPISRQVRRQMERKGQTKIASIVRIRGRRSAPAKSEGNGGTRHYTHRWERRAHFHHLHSNNRHYQLWPGKVKPCHKCSVEYALNQQHLAEGKSPETLPYPTTESPDCIKVWYDAVACGPEDLPLVKKIRLRAKEEDDGNPHTP